MPVDWSPFGNNDYVRNISLYDRMRWDLNSLLTAYIVCPAPFGGPIALTRDLGKMIDLMGGTDDEIIVYSSSGAFLSRFSRESDCGRLIYLGWSGAERLYSVYENGQVKVNEVLGALSPLSFALFDSFEGERVTGVALARDSLAVSCSSHDGFVTVYLVDGLSKPYPVCIRDTGLPPCSSPTCLALLDGSCTSHGRAEVLLGSPECSIIVLDPGMSDSSDPIVSNVPVESVPRDIVSSHGPRGSLTFFAVLGEDGRMRVYSSDLGKCYLEFDARSGDAESLPQMAWMGMDGVALCWRESGKVLLVNKFGDSDVHEFGEEVCISSEVDSLKVLGADFHTLLQRVPQPLVDIEAFGSTLPAAQLGDAFKAFTSGSSKCYEMIRELEGAEDPLLGGSALRAAVQGCISAALVEWGGEKQRCLLQAACYGKSFTHFSSNSVEGGDTAGGKTDANNNVGMSPDPQDTTVSPTTSSRDAFSQACKKLRVLNALRTSDAGMPLTALQLEELTPPVVMERLLSRHKHKLALALSHYLGLQQSKERALSHWACEKVRRCNSLDDGALASLITRRLARDGASVCFADIAAAADAAGKRVLATILLEHEPRARDRVRILLLMKERRLALEKALEAGDGDLVYTCCSQLRVACTEEGLAGAGLGGLGVVGADEGLGEGGLNSSYDDEGDEEDSEKATAQAAGKTAPNSFSSASPSFLAAAAASSGIFPPPSDPDFAFLKIITPYPWAVDLMTQWSQQCSPALSLKLNLAAGRWLGAARAKSAILYASSSQDGLKERLLGLKGVAEILKDGEKRVKSGKSRTSIGSAIRHVEELGKLKTVIEEEERVPAANYLQATTAETLSVLLAKGGKSATTADKAAKTLGLPEGTYWWIKAKAFIQAQDFKGLEDWAGKTGGRLERLSTLLTEMGYVEEGKKYAAKGAKGKK